MPSTTSTLQQTYDHNAALYNQFLTLPLGALEAQLFTLCITNFTDQHVLDLGGGTGARARDALLAGARSVDVIDISPEMMRAGQLEHERDDSGRYGRPDAVRWLQADVSKPLDHLGELGLYDTVIANGIFDHAETRAELEGMWRNAAEYLKPGGLVIANRNNPRSKAVTEDGKYGVRLTDFEEFEGGLRFKYRMRTEPELVFNSCALDCYYKGSLEVPGKWFEGFENVDWRETPVVKADEEFWRDYLDDPLLFIFTARRKR